MDMHRWGGRARAGVWLVVCVALIVSVSTRSASGDTAADLQKVINAADLYSVYAANSLYWLEKPVLIDLKAFLLTAAPGQKLKEINWATNDDKQAYEPKLQAATGDVATLKLLDETRLANLLASYGKVENSEAARWMVLCQDPSSFETGLLKSDITIRGVDKDGRISLELGVFIWGDAVSKSDKKPALASWQHGVKVREGESLVLEDYSAGRGLLILLTPHILRGD